MQTVISMQRAIALLVLLATGLSTPLAAAEKSGLAPVLIEKVSAARQLELLQAICEPGQVAIRDGVPVCSACPAYTTGGDGTLRIANVINGSFTQQGKQELLVDLAGCEPPSANAGGSALLAAADGGGWSRLSYLPGFRSGECVRFRSLQLTLSLACNMSGIEDGIQRGRLVWLKLRGGTASQSDLLAWYDNSRSDSRHLLSVFPHRFMKSDFNSDGRVDLQVSVRLRDAQLPEKYATFVEALAAGYRPGGEESLRLIFLFDGSTLVPAPHSEAGLARIDALLKPVRDR